VAVKGSTLGDFLDRQRKLALDTSVFIYAVEENPTYLELVRPILKWVEGAKGKR
jgi:hypothetical protein